jgi:putative nucleotidyltransferase with HDIG domain
LLDCNLLREAELKKFAQVPIYQGEECLVDITATPADSPSLMQNEQLRRKKRLMEIIEHGLPPFPHTVVELTAVLSSPSADVRKAAKLIRTDPSLSAHVLRLCNSPLFALRSRVIGIEQAAALLGTDRLRSIAMTGSLVDFAECGLPKDQVNAFWKHSFLAALLSEHLAKYRAYPEKEQAYIAGLLHDIGQVPHWMLAAEEKAKKQAAPPENWPDNTSIERDHFGMDHCEIGSRMARSWNFMPSFIDVLVSHHEPEQAQHDPYLVQIIAAVEHFLLAKAEASPADGDTLPSPDQPQQREASPEATWQPFADADWHVISEHLENEYHRLLPLVERGVASVTGGAN